MADKEKKRVVLFLVEGESETKALELPLASMIDTQYKVLFVKKKEKYEDDGEGGGDITSQKGITPKNIESIITKLFIKSYMEIHKFFPKHIQYIFHIMDLDGAFLDDSRIEPIKAEHRIPDRYGRIKPYYNDSEGVIEADNTEFIADRNKRKRENIEYLISLDKIKIDSKSIPYYAFYFTSNLDHFINNDANMRSGKSAAAEAFSMNYEDDPEGFCRFFCDDPDSTQEKDYRSSWEQVKEETYSVERHTNINLIFDILKSL